MVYIFSIFPIGHFSSMAMDEKRSSFSILVSGLLGLFGISYILGRIAALKPIQPRGFSVISSESKLQTNANKACVAMPVSLRSKGIATT